jgi:hypothetical protein
METNHVYKQKWYNFNGNRTVFICLSIVFYAFFVLNRYYFFPKLDYHWYGNWVFFMLALFELCNYKIQTTGRRIPNCDNVDVVFAGNLCLLQVS